MSISWCQNQVESLQQNGLNLYRENSTTREPFIDRFIVG